MTETIFALSSGGLPSGVAIIRLSGPQCRLVLDRMCPDIQFGRAVGLSRILDPDDGALIDRGLILTFQAPKSFTGEDVVEFQVHGSRAVVDAVFYGLMKLDGIRPAEAGEFTYRAFENGKMDLLQVEGLADLIASESDAQRIQALTSIGEQPHELLEGWLRQLLHIRALIEAEIDFTDEDDIPQNVSDQVWNSLNEIIQDIAQQISLIGKGEIIREGYKVTLAGRPNAGKSTLLNILAGRDVAIVTDVPGTTRDVLEVRLNLGGQLILVSDTAGMHQTEDQVEHEGIIRAKKQADQSDLVIWLGAPGDQGYELDDDIAPDLFVGTKQDRTEDWQEIENKPDLMISSTTGFGIDKLIEIIESRAGEAVKGYQSGLFNRARHFERLRSVQQNLENARDLIDQPLELRAEYLRLGTDGLGMLVGRVDVEDILGVIFSEFCVGK